MGQVARGDKETPLMENVILLIWPVNQTVVSGLATGGGWHFSLGQDIKEEEQVWGPK